jgi:hypothetical protein
MAERSFFKPPNMNPEFSPSVSEIVLTRDAILRNESHDADEYLPSDRKNEAPRRKQRGIFTGAMFLSPQAAGNLP